MRLVGKRAIAARAAAACVVLALARAERLGAQDAENPYQSIVDRNVFALKPPPDPESLKPPAPPPPPIELQGITALFGRKRVLFTVTVPGNKPGEGPKRTALILAEGERQDDVEVLAIDEKTGTVRFNNHGQEEIKTLEKDSTKIVAAPAAPGAPPAPPPGVAPATPPATAVNPPVGAGHAGATLRNIPVPPRPVRVVPVPSPQPPQAGQPPPK